MKKDILLLLEKNSRLSPSEIAAMLSLDEKTVEAEIKAMEAEGIIRGYHTEINWDKFGDDRVNAIIGLKISPMRGEGFDRIAERISRFEEVKSVYLMSGSSQDLLLSIEGDSLKDISHFVYEKIATMDTVMSTATYFVLKKYKDHYVSLAEDAQKDERIQMTI